MKALDCLFTDMIKPELKEPKEPTGKSKEVLDKEIQEYREFNTSLH